MKKTHRYRRGDWNPEKTKRFWGYLKGAEGWLSPSRFTEAQDRTKYWGILATSDLKLLKKLRDQHHKRMKRRR